MATFKPTYDLPQNRTTFLAAQGLRMGKLNRVVTGGQVKSDDYVAGTSGWNIPGSGSVEFNAGTFRGAIASGTIDIGGSDTSSFHVDSSGNAWLGASSLASSPWRVNATGTMQVGSSGTAFQADTSGNIWLGASTLASSPWRVNSDGTMQVGSSGTAFRADASGNHWVGASSLSTATFRVNSTGSLQVGSNASTSFFADTSGNVWAGHATRTSAKYQLANTGTLTLYNNSTGDRFTMDADDIYTGTTPSSANIRLQGTGAATFKGTTIVNNLLTNSGTAPYLNVTGLYIEHDTTDASESTRGRIEWATSGSGTSMQHTVEATPTTRTSPTGYQARMTLYGPSQSTSLRGGAYLVGDVVRLQGFRNSAFTMYTLQTNAFLAFYKGSTDSNDTHLAGWTPSVKGYLPGLIGLSTTALSGTPPNDDPDNASAGQPYLQAGYYTGTTGGSGSEYVTVTLPTTFPGGVLAVLVTQMGEGTPFHFESRTVTTSSFRCWAFDIYANVWAASTNVKFSWLAVGW